MPPRGGRGGGRGRGGSRAKPGFARVGDMDIPIDDDVYNPGDGRPQPSETFPHYKPSVARPLSAVEKLQIARYCSIRDRIHQGPLYTTFEDAPQSAQAGQKRTAAAAFDPFNGMETYSQRYMTKRKRIPRLDTRPYVLRFFPEELHSILDPTSTKKNRTTVPAKRKRLQVDIVTDEIEGEAEEAEVKDEDDEGVNRKPPEEGEEVPDEDVDDDFEEDEDEMGGDYNAEGYFDDGGDDIGDDDVGDPDAGGGGDYD